MQRESLGETRHGDDASSICSNAENASAFPKPRLIAIASGKGGVGKTWLTLTLAQMLTKRGARTLVVDADFGLANADIQIGHLPSVDVGATLRNQLSIAESIVPIEKGGFDLLAGNAGSGSLAGISRETVDGFVGRLLTADLPHDLVLLDLGTGVEPAARQLAALAHTVVLVTTEDPTSLTDGYAVLKLLQRDHAGSGIEIDVRIVVNQTSSERSGRRAHASLARAARGFLKLDPPLLGLIPRDDSVTKAIQGQYLFLSMFPKSVAAGAIQTIARRLLVR